jgi:GTPase
MTARLPIRGRAPHDTRPQTEQAFLVAADVQGHGSFNTEDSVDELAQLVDTAGATVVGRTIQKVERLSGTTYVGKGKLQEIAAQRDETGYTTVVFDDELSPTQQKTLEAALKVKVIDRTALILDIFARRARTREGQLQVELAQMEYLLPRLAGQWSHLERLGGGIGTRGPGETQIETDRRLIRLKITHLKTQIEGVPVVALVGYTNAGKSTLMNALSGAGVLAENRLFATLDPVTRRVRLDDEQSALLTDTVGFIQKLPTGLVAAFRATLEELSDADLLLHVVDITDDNAAEQAEAVEETLRSLGVAEKPRLTVLNKVDRLTRDDGAPVASLDDVLAATGDNTSEDEAKAAEANREDVVLVSAERGWGLDTLRTRIAAALNGELRVAAPEPSAAAQSEPEAHVSRTQRAAG